MGLVSVRGAAAGDLDELVRFQLAMATESEDKGLDVSVLSAGIEYLLAHPPEGLYLIAEVAAKPVGSLMLTFEWSDWRDGRFWWIQSVFVEPAFRRQGVYAALHAQARNLAQDDCQACGIRLYVERENDGAQATYRKLGMIETHYRLYEEEF